jgi:hypothetical protein
MAVVTFRTCRETHGRDTLVTALQCVTQTENGKQLGLLVGPVIKALCTLLSANLALRKSGETLMAAFETDLEDELEGSRSATKPKDQSTALELTSPLQLRLAKRTLSTVTRLAA